jgi:hypothetical protein
MRPPRLVLIGITALLASATVSTGADARPRLPGILGAVIGTVGGIVGVRHYARGGTRHHARHEPAGTRREAAAAPAETPTEPPQRNLAAAGQITAAGLLFWPTLSDDVFAYVLWPSGNDRLWAYGYGDVVDGALRPADPIARPLARRSRPQTNGSATASADGGAPACTHPQGTQTADALIERVEQTIEPTDAQRPAMDELRAAAQRAIAYTDAACPANRVQTPTARLDSMEDRLWAARQALMVMRAPIEKLYGSLNDEQKARLNGPVPGTQRAATCAQASVQQPTALLEQRIRPTPGQRAGLEAVKMTSAGLAKMVAASCPSEMPLTPLARLDAADKRLNTLLYAVVTLRAPVDAFYASLSDAQKTRLSGLSR